MRVERVRPLDVLLDEVLLVLGDRDVEPAVRDEPPVLDCVRIRLGEGDELVVLSDPDTYAIEAGRLVSNRGLDIPVAEYERHFVEEHVEWSNALHSRTTAGGNYLVGPLARWALSGDRLSPLALEAAKDAGLERSERNPFRTILIRSVELVYAADEALRIIADYEEPDAPAVAVEPRAGVGFGCTEAPRGILYHRYEIDEDGAILDAKIVPPTSQNQRTIEEDLRDVERS